MTSEIPSQSQLEVFDALYDEVESLLMSLPDTSRKTELLEQLDDSDEIAELNELKKIGEKILAARDQIMQKRFWGSRNFNREFYEKMGLTVEEVEQTKEKVKRFESHLMSVHGNFLGDGQTAEVYTHPSWPNYCAKLILFPEEYKKVNDVYTESMFLDELRDLHEVGSGVPEVVAIHMDEETHYYVMERIIGYTLAELMSGSGHNILPENFDFEESFAALERAVKLMHEKGIHHRDLYEGNIMLDTRNNRFVIIDFGKSIRSFGEDDPYLKKDEHTKTVRKWLEDDVSLANVKVKLKSFLLKNKTLDKKHK